MKDGAKRKGKTVERLRGAVGDLDRSLNNWTHPTVLCRYLVNAASLEQSQPGGPRLYVGNGPRPLLIKAASYDLQPLEDVDPSAGNL